MPRYGTRTISSDKAKVRAPVSAVNASGRLGDTLAHQVVLGPRGAPYAYPTG